MPFGTPSCVPCRLVTFVSPINASQGVQATFGLSTHTKTVNKHPTRSTHFLAADVNVFRRIAQNPDTRTCQGFVIQWGYYGVCVPQFGVVRKPWLTTSALAWVAEQAQPVPAVPVPSSGCR
jgi:hypothetical protein